MNLKKMFLKSMFLISSLAFAGLYFSAPVIAAKADKTKTSANYSDAQIIDIVETINEGEVDLGKLAVSKTTNSTVKNFAQDMINAHTASDKEFKDFASTAKIKPKTSATNVGLETGKTATKAKLEVLSGKSFDKAYANSQVDMHQKALNLLNEDLIPSARDTDLKNLLTKTRDVVSQHLDHAKSLNQSFSS